MQAEVHEGGGGVRKLLGIVNPSRSAKEHATERGCRGHTYIRFLTYRSGQPYVIPILVRCSKAKNKTVGPEEEDSCLRGFFLLVLNNKSAEWPNGKHLGTTYTIRQLGERRQQQQNLASAT